MTRLRRVALMLAMISALVLVSTSALAWGGIVEGPATYAKVTIVR